MNWCFIKSTLLFIIRHEHIQCYGSTEEDRTQCHHGQTKRELRLGMEQSPEQNPRDCSRQPLHWNSQSSWVMASGASVQKTGIWWRILPFLQLLVTWVAIMQYDCFIWRTNLKQSGLPFLINFRRSLKGFRNIVKGRTFVSKVWYLSLAEHFRVWGQSGSRIIMKTSAFP